jgi:hypothetical protein
VKWLFDIKLVAQTQRVDWGKFISYARDAHVATAVGMTLVEARRRIRAPIPQDVVEDLAPRDARQRVARRVAVLLPPRIAGHPAGCQPKRRLSTLGWNPLV